MQHLALQIVLGDGNDSVYLKQTTGNVTVLGGRGNDSLVVSSGTQSLGQIGGEVRFDGAAHIDEATHQVSSLTELGLPIDLALPNVFVNTAGATTTLAAASAIGATNIKVGDVSGVVAGQRITIGTGATAEQVIIFSVGTAGSGGTGITLVSALTNAHTSGSSVTTAQSFVDAGGRTIRYASAGLQKIVFSGSGGLMVNAVVLRSDGEIVTDLLREEGVQEKGVVEQGKQKWDADDNPLWLHEDFSVDTEDTGVPFIVPPGSSVNAGAVMYVCIDGAGNRVLSSSPACTDMRPSIVTAMTDPAAQFVYLDAHGDKTFSATASTSSLTASVDADDTTLLVAVPTGGAWVTGSNFTVTIGAERIRVTATSATATTLLVVQRGADGTTAAAHDVGSDVSVVGATNFPNRKSFVTTFPGTPLFVDTHGLRTDVPPTTLLVDNAGADITVYAKADGAVNFGAITVQVSTNGTTWKTATASRPRCAFPATATTRSPT